MYSKSKQLSQKAKAKIDQQKIDLKESLRGLKGEQGIQGIQGEKGLAGVDGIAGDTGMQGEAGQRGLRGPQGEQGPKGTRGEPGKDGTDGEDGRGIVRMQIQKMDLIVTYTDGQKVNLGRVEGPQGPQGMRGASVGIGIQATNIKQGFIDYNDSATALNPVVLSEDTWEAIPNDGLGAFTNKIYLPTNVTELMDNTTGKIDPTQLQLGDIIIIRNDFTVIPQTNNASLRFRYTLGSGAGAYTLEKRLGRLDEGSGIEYRFSLATDKIYMGDANTRDNHIGLEIKSSTPATLVNSGTVISVMKYEV